MLAKQAEAADLCQFLPNNQPRAPFIFHPPSGVRPFEVAYYWSNDDHGCVPGGIPSAATPLVIHITSPKDGASILWGKQVSFASTVSAPQMNGIAVNWTSNRDGNLCSGIACDAKSLSFGLHILTATLTDMTGAKASASIKLNAISQPPSAVITYPTDGSDFFTGQKINVRGYGSSQIKIILPMENSLGVLVLSARLPPAPTFGCR